jgi:hypothetical protein
MTQPRVKIFNHRAKDAAGDYNNKIALGQLKILESQIERIRDIARFKELSAESVGNIQRAVRLAVRLMDIR